MYLPFMCICLLCVFAFYINLAFILILWLWFRNFIRSFLLLTWHAFNSKMDVHTHVTSFINNFASLATLIGWEISLEVKRRVFYTASHNRTNQNTVEMQNWQLETGSDSVQWYPFVKTLATLRKERAQK